MSDGITNLYEAGRLPAPLHGLAVAAIQAAGVQMVALASPANDAGTSVVYVPAHAVTPAAMIINELCRCHAPLTQDAYSGGSMPGAAEVVQ